MLGINTKEFFSRRIYMKIEFSSHQPSRRDVRCKPAIMPNDRFPVGTLYNDKLKNDKRNDKIPCWYRLGYRLQASGKSVILVRKKAQKG